jgi:hypothetical protein
VCIEEGTECFNYCVNKLEISEAYFDYYLPYNAQNLYILKFNVYMCFIILLESVIRFLNCINVVIFVMKTVCPYAVGIKSLNYVLFT